MEPMRKVQTTITMDPSLIAQMDQAAEAMDRSRSYVARIAFEEFLASRSPPLGGQGHATLPGTPATAAVRGVIGPNGSTAAARDAPSLGAGTAAVRASPASSGGGFPLRESLHMPSNPLGKLMDECCAPVRRQQEQHAAAQIANQGRRNGEANSPAPQPQGAGTGEH
jgi:hypothetical protein